MSAFAVYPRNGDISLADIFLESEIKSLNPNRVLKYSLKKAKFRDIAEQIFNFSLFGGETLYFLENAEALKSQDLNFLKEKLDFTQIKDHYIFSLSIANTSERRYRDNLTHWKQIKGLYLKELMLNSNDIKNYLEKITAKKLSPLCLEYIANIYKKNCNFKEIKDACLNSFLYSPDSEDIDIKILHVFLADNEPADIKYLYLNMQRKDLKRSLETLNSLLDNGHKEDDILRMLIYRLARNVNSKEAEYVIGLDKKSKTGKYSVSVILLELLFFYCQKDVLEAGIAIN